MQSKELCCGSSWVVRAAVESRDGKKEIGKHAIRGRPGRLLVYFLRIVACRQALQVRNPSAFVSKSLSQFPMPRRRQLQELTAVTVAHFSLSAAWSWIMHEAQLVSFTRAPGGDGGTLHRNAVSGRGSAEPTSCHKPGIKMPGTLLRL